MTNVRFNLEKNCVISIGGADHAIFQWTFISQDAAESINNSLMTKDVENPASITNDVAINKSLLNQRRDYEGF